MRKTTDSAYLHTLKIT